jgi:coproporphyrinogen III oxidase
MSLPPVARWIYDWKPEAGSEEEKLANYYLQHKNWI